LVPLAEEARVREGVVAHFGEVAKLSLADPWFGLVVEATTGEKLPTSSNASERVRDRDHCKMSPCTDWKFKFEAVHCFGRVGK
jgi:hypothetical protein